MTKNGDANTMKNLVCKKCGEPVPPYLYAINFFHHTVIWVNENAQIVPCLKCGADVREGNTAVEPAGAENR